jgi:hypothetical protein
MAIRPYETRPVLAAKNKSPGYCIICAAVATTEALFRLDGAVIVQRYCDKCLSDAKYVASSLH